MDNLVREITIVGGGTAGWLTAGVIAAEHMANSDSGVKVTLVESPDVKPIGVGEPRALVLAFWPLQFLATGMAAGPACAFFV